MSSLVQLIVKDIYLKKNKTDIDVAFTNLTGNESYINVRNVIITNSKA